MHDRPPLLREQPLGLTTRQWRARKRLEAHKLAMDCSFGNVTHLTQIALASPNG